MTTLEAILPLGRYNSDRILIQIAQAGGDTFVHIWKENSEKNVSFNIKSLVPVVTLCTGKLGSIDALGFSCDGKYLCVVGADNQHLVHIFDWQNKKELYRKTGHSQRILDVVFHPTKPNEFVTVGEKHVKFWEITAQELKGNNGLFGDVSKLKVNHLVSFNRGHAVCSVRWKWVSCSWIYNRRRSFL
jgi:microtubule-associated protein-like 6